MKGKVPRRALELKKSKRDGPLSWGETYRACVREREDWKDLEATLADGIDELIVEM